MIRLIDNTTPPLEEIIQRLQDNGVEFKIEYSNGLVMKLETDDAELLEYARNNNPNLEEVE